VCLLPDVQERQKELYAIFRKHFVRDPDYPKIACEERYYVLPNGVRHGLCESSWGRIKSDGVFETIVLHTRTRYVDGYMDGHYVKLNPDGHVIDTYNCENMKIEGLRIYIDSKNDKVIEHYHLGELVGNRCVYAVYGFEEVLFEECEYKDGMQDGIETLYWRGTQTVHEIRIWRQNKLQRSIVYNRQGALIKDRDYSTLISTVLSFMPIKGV
jgi:antitoxin component YwqK of YwqJK toxin-antitoxin module